MKRIYVSPLSLNVDVELRGSLLSGSILGNGEGGVESTPGEEEEFDGEFDVRKDKSVDTSLWNSMW